MTVKEIVGMTAIGLTVAGYIAYYVLSHMVVMA